MIASPLSEALIIDAVRTPMGRYRGALAGVRPDDLAAKVIAAAVERTGLDTADVTDVYWGAANQAGEDNRDVARMAALLAGLPVEVPGVTVNRLCASGLEAVNQASRALRLGEADLYLAGGSESMSRAPWVMAKPETPLARGPQTLHDTALGWRLINPRMAERYSTEAMGETAENVAERYGVSRSDQDAFALRSHQRAVAAQEARAVRRAADRRRGPGREARRDGHGRGRRGAAGRHDAREAGRAEARLPRGRHGHRRQRLDAQRRRRLRGARLRGEGRRARRRAARAGGRERGRRRRPRRTWAIGPIPAIRTRPRRRRARARPDRPDRDQRGVRRPGARLRARARHRRGAAQRQRRRDRARPPARLLGRPPDDRARLGAAPARRPLRHRGALRRRGPGAGDGDREPERSG